MKIQALKALVLILSTWSRRHRRDANNNNSLLMDPHLAVASAVSNNDNNSLLMQELMNVRILEPDFHDSLLSDHHQYYVTVSHGDTEHGAPWGDDASSSSSLILEKTSDRQRRALMNIIVKADGQNPIQCHIYKKDYFFGDRKVGTVEFAPEELLTTNFSKRKTLIKPIQHVKGHTTRTNLAVQMRPRSWKDVWGYELDDLTLQQNSHLDPYFTVSSMVLNNVLDTTKNPTASELLPPQEEAKPDLEFRILLGGLLKFPKKGEFASVTKLMMAQMAGMNLVKITDRNTPHKSRASAIADTRKMLKKWVPRPPEGWWKQPNSDDGLTRVYFSSLGMYFLSKRKDGSGGYVGDTTMATGYKYRPGYEPYGCKVYFDKHGKVERIEDFRKTYYPHQEDQMEWEWAKLKARTSAFTLISIRHVCDAHYVWGNAPGTAMRMFLPKDHPVRRAFSVHFYKTAYTCSLAENSLFAGAGILARALNLEYKGGLEAMYADILRDFQFEWYPDVLKERGMDKCDFMVANTDGRELHTILHMYVSEFLDDVYHDDPSLLAADLPMQQCWAYLVKTMNGIPAECTLANMKRVWTEIIWRVTGYHASIGQVAQYALDPSMVNIRLKPYNREACQSGDAKAINECLMAPFESSIGIGMITAVTVVDCPRLNQDWSQVFTNPKNRAYANLRRNLDELGVVIDRRNKKRYANVDFHPKNTAISISS